MHRIELTRAEPLAFIRSLENACKNKQLFFLLAQISTTYHQQHRVHERFNSILGRVAVAHTHMGHMSWWSGRGLGNGCVGC